jgi:hypothetical protein
MRARIAFDTQMLALVEAKFVFGMKRGAAADHVENAAQAVVVLDQQRAGDEPMKTFTPAQPGARSSRADD